MLTILWLIRSNSPSYWDVTPWQEDFYAAFIFTLFLIVVDVMIVTIVYALIKLILSI